MVIYKCKCGDELAMTENTEKSRDEKRAFKEKHHKDKGHGWVRLTVKRGKYA